MDELEKQTFLFFSSFLIHPTLFVEGKAKQAKETYSEVCYNEQNANS